MLLTIAAGCRPEAKDFESSLVRNGSGNRIFLHVRNKNPRSNFYCKMYAGHKVNILGGATDLMGCSPKCDLEASDTLFKDGKLHIEEYFPSNINESQEARIYCDSNSSSGYILVATPSLPCIGNGCPADGGTTTGGGGGGGGGMPPGDPGDLDAFVIGNQVNLTWPNVLNEDGYKIERTVDDSGSPDNMLWGEIADVGADITDYQDPGLASGTYWYRIKAYNGDGESGYYTMVSGVIIP